MTCPDLVLAVGDVSLADGLCLFCRCCPSTTFSVSLLLRFSKEQEQKQITSGGDPINLCRHRIPNLPTKFTPIKESSPTTTAHSERRQLVFFVLKARLNQQHYQNQRDAKSKESLKRIIIIRNTPFLPSTMMPHALPITMVAGLVWMFCGSWTGVVVDAYIHLHAVPRERQVQWLKQMTADLTHVRLGQLSKEQITTAPEIMYAWSLTPQKSTEKALALESLVKRLVDERRAGNELVSDLTVNDYNCLLEGWARSGAGDAAAERCERILERMEEEGGLVKPDLCSYKTVLMAWRHAEGQHSAHRAQRILESMIRKFQEDPRVNSYIMPDSDCFDIVLQSWSRCGHPQAPENAERVLAAMERLYENTGSSKLKPRTTSFNAVLASWSRSSHANAADRAYDLLGFMELLEESGDTMVAPDKASYCTAMGALAKQSGHPFQIARKAERLLRRAEKRYRAESSVVPDAILFNTAMGCWAKAKKPGAFRYARSILNRQISLYESGCLECRPDVFGYTSVIASAAAEGGSAEDRLEAFDIAVSTYRRMENDKVKPNHVTYGNMLKACSRLLPPNSPARKKWTKRIFLESRQAGCVGDMVLSRLRECVPNREYKRLMEGHTKRNIPKAWTAKLPAVKNERKQRLSRRKMAEV